MSRINTNIPAIQAIKDAGLREDVLIFVGGAPVTQEYCDNVGADGYAPNASVLVRVLKEMLGIA
jgi:methanogenic corrinoid protein MtbC1